MVQVAADLSTEDQGTALKGTSVPADQVRLGWGFYPLIRHGSLTISDESLSFETVNASKQRGKVFQLKLDKVREVDTEKWPHPIIALALWLLIPWSAFDFSRLANLNLYTGTQGFHFRVHIPDEAAGLIRGNALASQSRLRANSSCRGSVP